LVSKTGIRFDPNQFQITKRSRADQKRVLVKSGALDGRPPSILCHSNYQIGADEQIERIFSLFVKWMHQAGKNEQCHHSPTLSTKNLWSCGTIKARSKSSKHVVKEAVIGKELVTCVS